MGRAKKKGTSSSGEFSLFDDADSSDNESDEDLPRDEAGRAKIKNQYVDLLGIRVQKLAGRILNRERINKTLEGIYFVCVRCQTVCHNLDEGLIEDADNKANICTPCSRAAVEPPKPPSKKASRSGGDSSPAKKKTTRSKAAASKSSAKPAAKTGASRASSSRSSAAKSSAGKSSAAKSSASRGTGKKAATRKKR